MSNILLTYRKIAISLYFKRAITLELTAQSMDAIIAQYESWGDEMSKKMVGCHWKSPFCAVYNFSETNKAEMFASGVICHHGILPQISIDPQAKLIFIRTPGYSC